MTLILTLLTIHWLADFVLQTDWQAQNKSKRWDALTLHVCTYIVPFAAWALWAYGNTPAVLQFLALSFVLHFITDALTSRVNSRLWAAKQVHYFFVSVGFDQLIHFYSLTLA